MTRDFIQAARAGATHNTREEVVNLVLSRSKKARKIGAGKWIASCVMPAHNDRNPSLTVTLKPDGVVLMRCHGCGASGREVCEALGIEPASLFPPSDNPRHYTRQSRHGFSAWQLLHALRDDLVFLVVAAEQMRRDGHFDQADTDCLAGVIERINGALEYMEGGRNG